MSTPETTNLLLTVLAVTAAAQFVLILTALVSFRRQLAQLRGKLAEIDMASLERRVAAATTDLRAVAAFTERLGKDIEHTVQETRAIVNRVSTGVQRTSRWLHAGLGFFEGGYRQAFAVGAGVGNGVRELFGRARRHEVASRLPAVLEDTPRMPARLGAGS